MIPIQKGCKDVLPAQSYAWQTLESLARRTAKKYGFREIRTPMFEATELFARGVGDTSDIVTKEMYTFNDKGGRSVTLRPEGTAGVARAFVENGLQGDVLPFKAYYIISAFRYERPQAGRLREFHQFGAELYGAESPAADAEVIALASNFLKSAKIKASLRLNSIGCAACREKYVAALREYFKPHLPEMCRDCNVRFEKNPLRMLDCKEEACARLRDGAPRITDYLCDDCRAHFEGVKEYLDGAGIAYTVDPRIVRGLDYYSRTVFEFVSDALGAQSAVLAGGRYDTLLEKMDSKPTPAVGFAAGLERLLMLRGESTPPPHITCYIAGMDAASRKKAFLLAEELRAAGVPCEADLMERSLKAQMRYADKLRAKYAIVLGERELAEEEADVKNMKTSAAERVNLRKLAQYFKGRKA